MVIEMMSIRRQSFGQRDSLLIGKGDEAILRLCLRSVWKSLRVSLVSNQGCPWTQRVMILELSRKDGYPLECFRVKV